MKRLLDEEALWMRRPLDEEALRRGGLWMSRPLDGVNFGIMRLCGWVTIISSVPTAAYAEIFLLSPEDARCTIFFFLFFKMIIVFISLLVHQSLSGNSRSISNATDIAMSCSILIGLLFMLEDSTETHPAD